jgi:predicted ArsR family transcriptional regulator
LPTRAPCVDRILEKPLVVDRRYGDLMSQHHRDMTAQLRIYRALSSQVRARLLDVLRDEPDLDAAELAQRVDLHVNTLRTHLGVLQEAGLVERVTEVRDRPGRPRLLYRAVPPDHHPVAASDDGYRFLATILASYVSSTSEAPASAAEQVGRAWGGYVVDKPTPFARLDPSQAVDRLVTMLEEFGFAPAVEDAESDRPRILLRRCPFLDVAREHQEVVCSIHLGLMRGALEQLDANVEAQDLIPWAQPEAERPSGVPPSSLRLAP